MSGSEATEQLEDLLEYLRRTRGFDFTGYKRTSLSRRLQQRMGIVGVKTYAEYIDYLEIHAGEFAELFNTLLINVTSFFRDPDAWDMLAADVVPRILSGNPGVIRVWSAACASGEEPYSVAIVLAEALGLEAFRHRVKIYATDVDGAALAEARQGAYTSRQLEGVHPRLRSRYFGPVGDGYVFRGDIRRSVIFGRHDLVQDAPISRLDLLICRNTLMYFNAELQSRILTRLHFALKDEGFLFLGRAEMLLTHGNLFTPVNMRHRVFMKAGHAPFPGRLPVLPSVGDGEAGDRAARELRLRELAFDHAPMAQFVVDADAALKFVNARARTLFTLTNADLGRPLQDLEGSYRPLELRTRFEQVMAGGQPIVVRDLQRCHPEGEAQYFDVLIERLRDDDGTLLGLGVTFVEVTRSTVLEKQLRRSHEELESAYGELQSTVEELERTNEELQSTVEELETVNEELRSTNEELETMNEELETVNTELRVRDDDLSRLNNFLESILTSVTAGVVVIDRQFLVQVWNRGAADLWGMRAEEVKGASLFSLDIGLPVERLREPIAACLDGLDQRMTMLDAMNRRGRPLTCRVTCTRLPAATGEAEGVVLLMDAIPLEETLPEW